jgi:hypothetical protein
MLLVMLRLHVILSMQQAFSDFSNEGVPLHQLSVHCRHASQSRHIGLKDGGSRPNTTRNGVAGSAV